jgi:hypothetical protein
MLHGFDLSSTFQETVNTLIIGLVNSPPSEFRLSFEFQKSFFDKLLIFVKEVALRE